MVFTHKRFVKLYSLKMANLVCGRKASANCYWCPKRTHLRLALFRVTRPPPTLVRLPHGRANFFFRTGRFPFAVVWVRRPRGQNRPRSSSYYKALGVEERQGAEA